jgi:hypothetical protein
MLGSNGNNVNIKVLGAHSPLDSSNFFKASMDTRPTNTSFNPTNRITEV